MMDKLSRDLEVARKRKESVMQACRQVNTESSAVMLMCQHLEYLEKHFDDIQSSLASGVEENLERERLLEKRSREVVAKENRLGFLQEEIRKKEEQLEIAERRLKECLSDCVNKGRESARLGALQEKVRGKEEELMIVEKRVDECDDELARTRGSLNQCLSMLKDREIELNSANRLLLECCGEYDLKKTEVDALSERVVKLSVLSKDYALKKDEIHSLNLDIEKKVIELQAKEKQHEAFQNSINEQLAVFDVKKQEFESLECSIKRITGELQARECELKRASECLNELEKKIESKNEEIASVQGLFSVLEAKNEAFQNSINEQLAVFEVKKQEFESLECSSKRITGELQARECELKSATECLNELEKKIESKNEELVSVQGLISVLEAKNEAFQNSINEQLAVFDVKKQEFESLECFSKRISGELQARECELKRATECLNELEKKIESKNEELASVQGLISVLEAKKGDLLIICSKIDKHNVELAKKEKEVECIQKRVRQREVDLQQKEKQAASLRSSIRVFLDDLEYKKSQLSCVNESLSHISKEVEFKKKDLEEIRQESMEYHWELERREKRLNFLQASLGEQCKLLELNERNFLEKMMDFEHRQRQQQLLSGENSQGVRLIPCSEAASRLRQVEVKSSENMPSGGSLIKAPASPTFPSIGCNTSNDEFMIWKLRGLDPSKEVLDIIEESFEQIRSCGDAGLSDSICRRGIYLLERMVQHAPPLMDGIKERALKIAREWELKLRNHAGRSEVVSFLCLLSAYKLVSYFDRHDIAKFAKTFSLYKSHPGICQAIGLVDMDTAPQERGTSSSSPRFPLRQRHRGTKHPLPATDARRLQLPPKRRLAPDDRS